jgi:hypothetical protein
MSMRKPFAIYADGQPLLSAGIAGEPPIASPGLPIVVPGTAVGTATLMDEPDARGPLRATGSWRASKAALRGMIGSPLS